MLGRQNALTFFSLLVASVSVLAAASKKPGQCDPLYRAEQSSAIQDYFFNVVLILNYNHNGTSRNSIKFWKNIYGRYFNRIYVVSESEDTEVGVMQYSDIPYDKVERDLKFTPGFFAYSVIPTIMKANPNAEGFLWTNDDAIVNYWNFLSADKTKIWFRNISSQKIEPLDNFTLLPAHKIGKTFFWKTELHRNTTEEALHQLNSTYLKNLQESVAFSAERLPATTRAFTKANTVPILHQGYVIPPINKSTQYFQVLDHCDVFYIPQRLAPDFCHLSKIFLSSGVYSEIAVPTMLYAMESPKNYDTYAFQDFDYLWGDERHSVKERYNPQSSGIHPWKLGRKKKQRDVMARLAENDKGL